MRSMVLRANDDMPTSESERDTMSRSACCMRPIQLRAAQGDDILAG